MRIYGQKFEDLMHGNPLMNVEFASAVGNLCMASVDVFKEIMKSDAKQPKALLKDLTGIDEIDKDFDFANYLDARNPETGEMISTARKDGKFLGVEMPESIEMPEEEDMHPVGYMLNDFMLGHNSHDEEKYRKCRKHAEEIVCLFYENLLSAKFVGIPAKRNYAAKIRKVIEEMMEEDWSNVQNGL